MSFNKHLTENNDKFVMNVYNPLPREVSRPIRLPVKSGTYVVSKLDIAENMTISSQLVPLPDPVYLIPGRSSQATHELVFMATNIPPMGNQMYHIEKVNYFVSKKQMSKRRLVIYDNLYFMKLKCISRQRIHCISL